MYRGILRRFSSESVTRQKRAIDDSVMKLARQKMEAELGQQNTRSTEVKAAASEGAANRVPVQDGGYSPVGLAVIFGTFGGLVGLGGYTLTRPVEGEDASIADLPLFQRLWKRAYLRSMTAYKYAIDPRDDSLLPDPYPPTHPFYRKNTLVLELDKLLVYSSWDKETGWKVAKRPWADYFLTYMSQFYEIVIFTSQTPFYAAPIIDKLHNTTQGTVSYRLYRDSTRYDIGSGDYVKDLSIINRDLGHVIMLDPQKKHFEGTQPENSILAPEWKGEAGDTWLLDMIPFLETLAMNDVMDIRQVLKNFPQDGKTIPAAYTRRVAEVYEARKKEYESVLKKHGEDERTHHQSFEENEPWINTLGKGVLAFFGFRTSPPPIQPPMSSEEYFKQKAMHYQAVMQEIEQHKQMQEQEAKAAEEEHKRVMEKANKIQVTLWEMMTKGVDQAVLDKADPEVRAFIERMQGAQPQ